MELDRVEDRLDVLAVDRVLLVALDRVGDEVLGEGDHPGPGVLRPALVEADLLALGSLQERGEEEPDRSRPDDVDPSWRSQCCGRRRHVRHRSHGGPGVAPGWSSTAKAESNALIIRTPLGNVLHTGDWKLDPTPIIGPPTDEAKLKRLGDEGCLALIGDFTNAVREGRSPSEADVAKTLRELIIGATGRIAVTTFASNVARMRAVAEAAAAAGREVVVVGRAMARVEQVARETGYLDGIADFRSVEAYGYLPRDKVVALCTGSQGEPRAAIARISEDQHPEVTLSQGDMVIFSSRTIPGNEKAVGKLINGLVRQGIEVITDRTHLVHVSGHPRRTEMAELYQWVRPRIAIPVHGEALHLSEHAKLARDAGVAEVILCGDGDLVRLAPDPAGLIDEVPAARLYKDGALLISAEARTVADRRRLSFSGIAIVALVLSEKGELLADPDVELIGIPEQTADKTSMFDVAYDAAVDTFASLPKPRRRDPQAVEESIKRGVRAAIAQHWQKKPICLVQVITV